MDAGYAIHPGVIPAEQCDLVLQALAGSRLHSARAGTRHLMSRTAVSALASEPSMIALARAFVGASAIPFRATLFEKTEQANWLIAWHQDTALPITVPFVAPGWGPWSGKAGIHYVHAPAWALARVIALRLHLDDSTADNGPLRVIPESHAEGVLTGDAVLARVATSQPIECLVPRGGVIAMRPLLIHASSKSISGQPRRVLHVEYVDGLELAPGIRLALA